MLPNSNHLRGEPFAVFAHTFNDGIKCPWFFLGSTCSFGLHVYCILKTDCSSFALSTRNWGYVQGRDIHKMCTGTLDVSFAVTAFRVDIIVCVPCSQQTRNAEAQNLIRQYGLMKLMSQCVR